MKNFTGKYIRWYRRRPIGLGSGIFLASLLAAAFWWALAAPPLPGQTVEGEPQDLSFQILNATTGGPGTLDRLVINYQGTLGGKILDEQPDGSEFTLRNVPIKSEGRYVVTAWAGGVPYFWELRGKNLIEQTTTLHVFETTDNLDGVQISGLNVIFRLQESIVKIEYMITATNGASPQVTVLGYPATLELTVPEGTTDYSAIYLRGPDPTPVEVHQRGVGRLGLAVPLTSGRNQIKFEAIAPWTGEIDFNLAFNLPVLEWSLLTAPESLVAESFAMEPDDANVIPGYNRMLAPPLEAGQSFRVHLVRLAGGEEEQLFTQEVPVADSGTVPPQETAGSPSRPVLWIVGLGVLLIIILVILGRRRQ